MGPALLLFLWLYLSSLPACVSVGSPALYCIVFTAVNMNEERPLRIFSMSQTVSHNARGTRHVSSKQIIKSRR